MKWSKILVLLLVVLTCRFAYAGSENTAIPTEEQVQKLVAAAWKEPIKSIDVTFYKDYMKAPESVEQLRKQAEGFADSIFKGRSIDELKPYEIEKRNRIIEKNLKNWLEEQKLPYKTKSRVWISGDNQRIDMVKGRPNESLGPNTPFADTFINTKDTNTGDFVSYNYVGEMKKASVRTKKWSKEAIAQFAGIPFTTALTLQFFLGIDQGSTPTSLNYIPDSNKMAELASTGLARIEPKAKGKKVVYRIAIRSAPNNPNTKDIIEIGYPNHFPLVVLICDREDYSRVYHFEARIPTKTQIMYIRECSDFDSQGVPHNITEEKYNKDGNLREMSIYKIEKVELNHVVPDEIFRFNPPKDYKVIDSRLKP